MPETVISAYSCARCEHVWRPVKPSAPVVCPKCKSPYWNRPKPAR